MFKCATLLTLPIIAGVALNYSNTGLAEAEVVPVLQKGEMVYAVRCTYRTLLKETSIEVGPVAANAKQLHGSVCPNQIEGATRIRFDQTGA